MIYIGWLLKLGGLGVIGMQLNFMAIPTSLLDFLRSLVLNKNKQVGMTMCKVQ